MGIEVVIGDSPVVPILPLVGSSMLNKFGLEFVVDQHIHVPRLESMARLWKDGKPGAEDLYPAVVLQNISPRLKCFMAQVGQCTPKRLLILDTTPELRRDAKSLRHHFINSLTHPEAVLLFTDAARVHETHLAHEIGHVWIQFVEHGEDELVFKEIDDVHFHSIFTPQIPHEILP